MCYVQIAGTLMATVATLVLVPVPYVVAVENLKLVRWDKKAEDEPSSAGELDATESEQKDLFAGHVG